MSIQDSVSRSATAQELEASESIEERFGAWDCSRSQRPSVGTGPAAVCDLVSSLALRRHRGDVVRNADGSDDRADVDIPAIAELARPDPWNVPSGCIPERELGLGIDQSGGPNAGGSTRGCGRSVCQSRGPARAAGSRRKNGGSGGGIVTWPEANRLIAVSGENQSR